MYSIWTRYFLWIDLAMVDDGCKSVSRSVRGAYPQTREGGRVNNLASKTNTQSTTVLTGRRTAGREKWPLCSFAFALLSFPLSSIHHNQFKLQKPLSIQSVYHDIQICIIEINPKEAGSSPRCQELRRQCCQRWKR
jgi:hypothetical protein